MTDLKPGEFPCFVCHEPANIRLVATFIHGQPWPEYGPWTLCDVCYEELDTNLSLKRGVFRKDAARKRGV